MSGRNSNYNDEGAALSTPEPYIFDSISVHFNIGVFFHQLLIHHIWPFGFLLSPNAKSQKLSTCDGTSTFVTHFGGATFLTMVASYFLMGDGDGSICYPYLYYFLHRATVSIKYASFSPSEYHRIMDPKQSEHHELFHLQSMLATGWMGQRDGKTIDFLLIEAALKTGAHVDLMDFVLDDPSSSEFAAAQFSNWLTFMSIGELKTINQLVGGLIPTKGETSSIDRDVARKYFRRDPHTGCLRVSVFEVCKKVVMRTDADANNVSTYQKISLVAAVLMSTLPGIGLLNRAAAMTTWGWVYAVTSSMINFTFTFLVVIFISVALIDLERLAICQQYFRSFIRLSDINSSTHVVLWNSSSSHNENAVQQGEGSENDLFIKQGELAARKLSEIQQILASHRLQAVNISNPPPPPPPPTSSTTTSSVLGSDSDSYDGLESGVAMSPMNHSQPNDYYKKDNNNMYDFPSELLSPAEAVTTTTSTTANTVLENERSSTRPSVTVNGGRRRSSLLGGLGMSDEYDATEPTILLGNVDNSNPEEFSDRAAATSDPVAGTNSADGSRSTTSKHYKKTSILQAAAASSSSSSNTTSSTRARPSIVSVENKNSLPRLSFRNEENLVSWCYARLILLKFGDRFTARLELFTWLCAIANALLMAATLGMIFGQSDPQERYAAFQEPMFREGAFSCFMFSVFLITYTYKGAGINSIMNRQRTTLSTHLMRVRERIIECNYDSLSLEYDEATKQRIKNEIQHWKNVQRAVESALQAVGTGNDHSPFSVMGFTANWALPKLIFSACFSFTITLFTAFYGARLARRE